MGQSLYKVKSRLGWDLHIPHSDQIKSLQRLNVSLQEMAAFPPKLRTDVPSEKAVDVSGTWTPSLGVDGFVALVADVKPEGAKHYILVKAGLDPRTCEEAQRLFHEAELGERKYH